MSRTAPRTFTVGLVQMRCSTDPDDNLRRACEALREAAGRGAQVACLPELFRTQYFCQVEDPSRFDLAEPIPGPTTEALAAVARETRHGRRRVDLRAADRRGLPQHGGRPRRRRVAPGPLPQDAHPRRPALLREVLLHSRRPRLPGARHAGRPRRHARLLGPVVSRGRPPDRAEGGRGPVLPHGDRLAPRREGRVRRGAGRPPGRPCSGRTPSPTACSSRPSTASATRGPPAGGLEFWGGSFVADPFGRLLARAGREAEEVLVATCDPRLQEETRRNWPFLRDRRIDAYGPITQRFLDAT